MPRPPPSRRAGFTLFELAMVLALVAALATLATPSLGRLRAQAVLRREANALLGALHHARSVAITQGLPVVLCQTAERARCLDSAAPASGWAVFVDAPGGSSGRLDAGDRLLESVELPTELRLSGSRRALIYWPAARAGTTATLVLCHARGAALAVIVSQTGRPRVSTTDASGGALDCGA